MRTSVTLSSVISCLCHRRGRAAHLFLLLELCSHVGHHDAAVRQGRWGQGNDFCFWDSPLLELAGKAFGIVGYGAIGQAVAQIAHGFGMRVLVYSTHRTPQEHSGIAEFVTPDALLRQSDVISLHCPLKSENTGLINRAAIARMKDGALLINTARGGLLNTEDVIAALQCGKLGGLGTDVLAQEPPAPDHPLFTAPNCVITPHQAWASKEARQRLIDQAAANLSAFLEGRLINQIN